MSALSSGMQDPGSGATGQEDNAQIYVMNNYFGKIFEFIIDLNCI